VVTGATTIVGLAALLSGACGSGGAPAAVDGAAGGPPDAPVKPDEARGTSSVDSSGAGFDLGPSAATAKFCNVLARAGAELTLTLEIGPAPVRLTATSGRCDPLVGQPCTPIPAGDLQVLLFEGTQLLATSTVTVATGDEMLFGATVDTRGSVVIEAGATQPGRCAIITPGR
jgi:hypothetical protein